MVVFTLPAYQQNSFLGGSPRLVALLQPPAPGSARRRRRAEETITILARAERVVVDDLGDLELVEYDELRA
jgi:hypothetical protein